MYGALFRILPGPKWLKSLQFLVLVAAAVLALFTWVYPWMEKYIDFVGTGAM